MFIGLGIASIIIILDQLTKLYFLNLLLQNDMYIKVCSFFNLIVAWNTGVSFSMFNDMGNLGVYVLSGFSVFMVGILIYWLKKETHLFMRTALGFIIGGALGNVIDRLRFGAVFDFLDIHAYGHHWPAFNLADSFICIGAIMLICDGILFNKCSTLKTLNNKE